MQPEGKSFFYKAGSRGTSDINTNPRSRHRPEGKSNFLRGRRGCQYQTPVSTQTRGKIKIFRKGGTRGGRYHYPIPFAASGASLRVHPSRTTSRRFADSGASLRVHPSQTTPSCRSLPANFALRPHVVIPRPPVAHNAQPALSYQRSQIQRENQFFFCKGGSRGGRYQYPILFAASGTLLHVHLSSTTTSLRPAASGAKSTSTRRAQQRAFAPVPAEPNPPVAHNAEP